MTVRFYFLIIRFIAVFSCVFLQALPSKGQCDNPVTVGSIIITNATCGNASGDILLSLVGGNNGYTYSWQPNVSNNNVASGLLAGAYTIHIVRNSNPDCVLDTTVIVNNSDGPSIQASEIVPANCVASNGKITMSPTGLNYTWSNGESGAVNTDLGSGCYYVTATNPGNGCYTVVRVCLPNTNPLQSSFQVIAPAKCGLPTGSGQYIVSGGSGQYSYSFGNSSVATGLAPGSYTFFIADNATGCLDTLTAVMTDAPLSGEVDIRPFSIKCTGQGTGNVEFDVIPGANFLLPFTFALWDQAGNIQSPGNLAAGTYYLQVADADSCLLPVDTFTISEPLPFSATTGVTAANCGAGGQIDLQLSGGNGRYLVDWSDLPGFDNPQDRLNLYQGFYSATIYDSLFCAYPVSNVLVPAFCAIPDTLILNVPVNSSGTLCLPVPAGLAASTLNFSIIAETEIFGGWDLIPDGCVKYSAGQVAKFGVDPVCVRVSSDIPGLSDTICVIVNITTQTVEQDSVYFAVQSGSTGTACGFIPTGFNNRIVTLLDGQGLSGSSDAFGIFSINPQSACITFESYGPTGYNVDAIGVAVCDTILRQCREIYYFPTVLSLNDCLDGVHLPDSLTLTATDCDAGATTCVPIPFNQILDYAILDNGQPYQGGQLSGCNQDGTRAYAVKLNGGPYQLNEWAVNGQIVSGFFVDRYELLGLMNQYDPVPGWTLEGDSIFTGGNMNNTYGPMHILSAQDLTIEAIPGQKDAFFGTNMTFSTGFHTMIFRRVQTGCLDTMYVRVICSDCPPVHSNVPNNQGDFLWNIAQCSGDTLFCTSLSSQELASFTVTDNGQVFSSYAFCGSNVALRLDTGTHVLHLANLTSSCEYDIRVRITCSGSSSDSSLMAVPDQANTLKDTEIEMSLLDNDIIFGVAGNIAGIQEFLLLSDPPNGTVSYDDQLGVITYTPDADFCGADTFSYRITDLSGRRSTAQVRVNVICDKLLVYNGISPNGDGKNDLWTIVGIEQFPDNEVRVFNRWGNLVFEQKGYSNLSAWGGVWNGRDLPDGAYFYVIDLGDGKEALSGYLHIMR